MKVQSTVPTSDKPCDMVAPDDLCDALEATIGLHLDGSNNAQAAVAASLAQWFLENDPSTRERLLANLASRSGSAAAVGLAAYRNVELVTIQSDPGNVDPFAADVPSSPAVPRMAWWRRLVTAVTG